MSAGMMSGPFGGGIGAGLGGILGSLFGSSPTSTSTDLNSNTSGSTSSTGTTSSTGSTSGGQTSGQTGGSTTNPNLPGWYDSFLKSLVPQYMQQINQAQSPVIGPQQQAQYIQGVNKSFGDNQQQLLSQLAKSGALTSGRGAEALTNLQLGKLNNINSYLASVPMQNAQFSQTFGNPLLASGMGFKAPYGSTSTNFGNAFQNYFGNTSNQTDSNSNVNTQSQTQSQQKQKNSGSGLLGAIFG